MMKRWLLAFLVGALLLGGCASRGGENDAGDEVADAGDNVIATATPLALAPTLSPETEVPPTSTPDDEEGAAPTPLPEPTQIVPEATPEDTADATPVAPVTGDGDPGIVIAPQLGAPGDIIVVTGSGWQPGAEIALHWSTVDGNVGPVYWEVETDENGFFEVGLIIPPFAQWPGGVPEERDLLQLRAMSDSIGVGYYFANFTYIPPIDSVTSLVQTFDNEDYGYQIRIPNLWTWSWIEDDTSDVRFQSPNTGYGFALVYVGAEVDALIPTVMGNEFPGVGYTVRPASAGAYPGSEAVADDGHIVLFVSSGGNVYVLSFINDLGDADLNIMGTLTLSE